jgi:tetratricopeptide (TPR) repeat protein
MGTIEAFNHAINLSPNLTVGYVNRGAAYQMIDKDEMAMADFQKAIDLDPENHEALYGMGRILYKEGKISEAYPYFKKINEELYIARIYDNLYRGYTRFTNNYHYWRYTYQW